MNLLCAVYRVIGTTVCTLSTMFDDGDDLDDYAPVKTTTCGAQEAEPGRERGRSRRRRSVLGVARKERRVGTLGTHIPVETAY